MKVVVNNTKKDTDRVRAMAAMLVENHNRRGLKKKKAEIKNSLVGRRIYGG